MCNGSVQISKLYSEQPSLGFQPCEETKLGRELQCHEKATAAPLKRKRPARIDIPVMEKGLVLETPRVVKREKEIMMEGIGYSVYCRKGMRGVMEDLYSAVLGLNGDSKQVILEKE